MEHGSSLPLLWKVLCLLLLSHDWEFSEGEHNLRSGNAAYLLKAVSWGTRQEGWEWENRTEKENETSLFILMESKSSILNFNKTFISWHEQPEECTACKWRRSPSLSAGVGDRRHDDSGGLLGVISRKTNKSWVSWKAKLSQFQSIFERGHYGFHHFQLGISEILDCAKIILNVLSASSVGDHSSNKVPIRGSCSSLARRYYCGGFCESMISPLEMSFIITTVKGLLT